MNADEFPEFYQRFERPIFGYLFRRTGDAELAADLAQDTFLRAWRAWSRATINLDTGTRQWIFQIARNALIDDARHRRLITFIAVDRLPLDMEPTATGSPEEITEQRELLAAAGRGLRQVAPLSRLAFGLSLAGYSGDEISRRCHVTRSGVKALVHRARQRVQAYIQRLEAECSM